MPDDVTFSVLVRGYGECEPVQWTAISGLLSLMERKYSQPPSISAGSFNMRECGSAVWGSYIGVLMLSASPAGLVSHLMFSVRMYLTVFLCLGEAVFNYSLRGHNGSLVPRFRFSEHGKALTACGARVARSDIQLAAGDLCANAGHDARRGGGGPHGARGRAPRRGHARGARSHSP